MERITEMPRMQKDENGRMMLYVDGAPYIALSGELHNSSSSSLAYMDQKIWPALRPLHMNTVILSVAWETFSRRRTGLILRWSMV